VCETLKNPNSNRQPRNPRGTLTPHPQLSGVRRKESSCRGLSLAGQERHDALALHRPDAWLRAGAQRPGQRCGLQPASEQRWWWYRPSRAAATGIGAFSPRYRPQRGLVFLREINGLETPIAPDERHPVRHSSRGPSPPLPPHRVIRDQGLPGPGRAAQRLPQHRRECTECRNVASRGSETARGCRAPPPDSSWERASSRPAGGAPGPEGDPRHASSFPVGGGAMADRLTQLQDAVNSVRRAPPFSLPRGPVVLLTGGGVRGRRLAVGHGPRRCVREGVRSLRLRPRVLAPPPGGISARDVLPPSAGAREGLCAGSGGRY